MRTIALLLALTMTLSLSAQNKRLGITNQSKTYILSEKQKKDLSNAAVAKVKRFQENCALIGGNTVTYDDKTCSDGYIDVALQDFLKDAKIEITSFDGKSKSRKSIRRYLLNLALLSKNTYKSINITSYKYAMVSNFTKDANKSMESGEEWYVGTVSVLQSFNAVTKENRVVSDVVERKLKIYAKRNQIYSNSGIEEWWDIKLGDINAKNVQ